MRIKDCTVEFLIETCRMEDISDEVYFSSAYKQYSSNSKISLINPDQEGSPQKYRDGIKQSYNASFEVGSAVHALTLQSSMFVLSNYEGKPSAKLGVFIDHIIKQRKNGLSIIEAMNRASITADYYSGKLTPKIIKKAIASGLDYYYQVVFNNLYEKDEKGRDIIVLPKNALIQVEDIMKSLMKNNKVFQKLYMNNFFETMQFLNEIALFIDIAVTLPNQEKVIIPFKLKIDNCTIDPEEKIVTLNDLKTTGKSSNYFMGGNTTILDEEGNNHGEQWINGSFQRFHYYRQMGVYMAILQLYCKTLGLKGYIFKSNMVVVESQYPYNCNVFPVNGSYIKQGLDEFKELMCRVAYHEINGYDIDELKFEDGED